MYLRNIIKSSVRTHIKWFLPQTTVVTRVPAQADAQHISIVREGHSKSCPVGKKPSSPGTYKGLIREERTPKCRMGFIPDDWFTFFYVKTGKSGFYVFLVGLANYCVSKEILVMEHEYYGGLSWIAAIYYISTRFGKKIGKALDKQVDALTAEYETDRNVERAGYQTIIKDATLACTQAEGQNLLMEAKKENVLMQLDAIYRERAMYVYRMVKGRMDYQVKLYYAEARIHQRWMVEWILRNVMKSITPDFQKQALDQAIVALERAASKA